MDSNSGRVRSKAVASWVSSWEGMSELSWVPKGSG